MAASGHLIFSAGRARQGRYGRQVLWMLQVSIALAALVLFGAWSWRAPDLAAADLATANPASPAPPASQHTPSSPRRP